MDLTAPGVPSRIPPQDDPPAFGRYMPALDGLRGIAVLGVMIMHFSYWYLGSLPLTSIGRIYIKLTTNGWMGVDLFFVLSGFLITGILIDSKGSPHFFRNFYARRTLRIFPLYYGVLVVVFLILPFTPIAQAGLNATRSNQAWLWLYGTNFAVYLHGWGLLNPYPLMVTHFWSLAVEEHFYLVWPVMVFLLSTKSLVRASIFFILSAWASRYFFLAHSHHGTASLLTFCRTDELIFGALLAQAFRTYSVAQILRMLRPVAVCMAVFLISERFTHGALLHNKFTAIMENTAVGLFASWLVAEAAVLDARSFFMPLLARSFLTTLGKYSYGMYVFHQLLNKVIYDSIGTRLPHIGPTPATVLYSCIAGAITFVTAFASYHLYEKWFLKLKRRFPVEAPAPVATAQYSFHKSAA